MSEDDHTIKTVKTYPDAVVIASAPTLEPQGDWKSHQAWPKIAGRYLSADWSPTRLDKQSRIRSNLSCHASYSASKQVDESTTLNDTGESRGDEDRDRIEHENRDEKEQDEEIQLDISINKNDTFKHNDQKSSHLPKMTNKPTRRVGRQTIRICLTSKKFNGTRTHSRLLSNLPTSPPTPITNPPSYLSQFTTAFGQSSLSTLQSMSLLDSIGSRLPPPLSDLFHTLSEPDLKHAIRIANSLRRALNVPLIPTIDKVDRLALRRAVALAREQAYVGAVAALSLPLAPMDEVVVDDGGSKNGDSEEAAERKEKVKGNQVRLTDFNKSFLIAKLRVSFPVDRKRIEAGAAGLYGEDGEVVWKAGVGRMRSDKNGVGFRSSSVRTGGVHVYLDYSNILYGLLDYLLTRDATSLPPRHQRILSLPLLSLLLLRGRPHPPGSLHALASSPTRQDLDPLVRLGWEVSVLKRVELVDTEVDDRDAEKLVPVPVVRSVREDGVGIGRYKEQGVDEILCLKILQTLNLAGGGESGSGGGVADKQASKVGVVVLATGDARGGQFNSDGFVGAVREALLRGWNVELWAFRSGLSRTWAEVARRERWDHRFSIHTLDPFGECLVEVGE